MRISDIYHGVLLRIPEVDVPKPDGEGEPIPDDLVDKVVQTMNLIAWGGTAAGVIGVLITGATMAISHKRGEASEHMSRLGLVMGGCVLVATAGPIVDFFFV
jgi:hypothetical protein